MKRQTNGRKVLVGALSVLLGALPGGVARAQASVDLPTVIKGIDIVGVPAAQAVELLRLLGLKEGMQVPYGRLGETVVKPAEAKLEGTGRFRAVTVHPTTFIGGKDDGATYLTISVVDRAAPAPQKAAPRSPLALPGPVSDFFAERVRGLGAFRDTLLPIDQDRLEALADAHVDDLVRSLREAADPVVRGRSAQAIAFHPDARRARQLLEDALLDPDAGVRRDVSRALLPLVERQVGRAPISPAPALALLRMPEPADRMNAASLLLRLARVPANRDAILRDAGGPLLAMARMKHPGESTLAMEALQVLSQAPAPKTWDEYRSWWEKTTAQRFVD